MDATALFGAMQIMFRLGIVPVLVAGAFACGIFDGGSTQHKGTAAGNTRCDVDLDQWKARVKRFKANQRQNKAEFQQAKNDLVNDLKKLDTDACRRELRNQISDLIEEVKQEHF